MAEQKRQTMIYSDEELALIKGTFKDNDQLLRLMRKVFLPEYDPNAPLGQVVDLWLALPIKEMSPEHAHQLILARNSLITHIENQLMVLDALAKRDEKTEAEIAAQNLKNSSK